MQARDLPALARDLRPAVVAAAGSDRNLPLGEDLPNDQDDAPLIIA